MCLLTTYSLSSFDVYTFATEIFSIGVEGHLEKEDIMYINFGLPTIYFFEKSTNLVLSVRTCELKFAENNYFDMSALDTRLMYSFIRSKKYLLGPFAEAGIESVFDLSFSCNVGLSFDLLYYTDIFDFIPNFVIRPLGAEVGYSIIGQDFYIKFTTDPFLLMYVLSYIYI